MSNKDLDIKWLAAEKKSAEVALKGLVTDEQKERLGKIIRIVPTAVRSIRARKEYDLNKVLSDIYKKGV